MLSQLISTQKFRWHNSLGKFSSDFWNLVPLCLMWTIWRERNRRTFNDVFKTTLQLLDCFTSTLFDWSTAMGFTTSNSVLDFIASLSLSPILTKQSNYLMLFVFMFYAH